MQLSKDYNLGLVLSGGAARGFAHPGVIKALHEFDMYPDIISGTSAGAIAGCFYADGYEPEEILELFKGKRFLDFTRLRIATTGLLEVSGLKKLLKKNIRAKSFDALQRELVVCVTNFRTGKAEYLHQGDLIEAVIASASIPALFTPVRINGDHYIDGGVVDNFPIFPIKDRCKDLVGVVVNTVGEETGRISIVSISIRSFQLSMSSEVKHKKGLVDIYIEPEKLKSYSFMDVKSGPEMFEIGYNAAKEILSKRAPILSTLQERKSAP